VLTSAGFLLAAFTASFLATEGVPL